ncbi:hypothetical protein F5148DRAFT_1287362 [Russula earlei]|uniref:Uncharacterized protein n=1 Tax=Russula earlei TaxID=71964 RepID=A0ACC0U3I3_9AGAM|nr:hypothetical protein F5148DRAFT_1287362 [Russula earlei]
MPPFEAIFQSAYPDEFTDAMADVTASILREQLAPILKTLQEHAKLLDMHAALLNHSNAMNRYNVGKLDDIRDFQSNINYKLQFFIEPEKRWHPNYRNPPVPIPPPSTENVPPNAESSLLGHAAGGPERPSTPATEPVASRPSSPRQHLGDAFGVVPRPSHSLQRERPWNEPPDPMWNTMKAIDPETSIAAPAPPPPYERVPDYEEQNPPAVACPVPLVRAPSAPEEGEEELAAALLSLRAAGKRRSSVDDEVDADGPLPSGSSSDTKTGDDGDLGSSLQVSEKARGKKRMRDDDHASDEEGPSGDPSEERGGAGGGRKRQKMDTRINTDRLVLDENVTMIARLGLVEQPPLRQRAWGAQKLKSMQRMFRGCGCRDSH